MRYIKCVKSKSSRILGLGLLASLVCPALSQAAPRDRQNCEQVNGVRLTAAVSFLGKSTDAQTALVPEFDQRSGFLQLKLDNDELTLVNTMSGVGLASDIFDISVEVVDDLGRVYPGFDKPWPQFSSCGNLTLFPGHSTSSLKLPFDRSKLPEGARLKIRLLVNSI